VQNSQSNETAYRICDQIRKKHRILISIVAIIILFYILFPIVLSSFMSEQNIYFLPLAWGYVTLLFLMTWGIGVWHFFFTKSFNRKLEERGEQAKAGGDQ
jgi:membrane-associated HD superfamily phosphohydrolase